MATYVAAKRAPGPRFGDHRSIASQPSAMGRRMMLVSFVAWASSKAAAASTINAARVFDRASMAEAAVRSSDSPIHVSCQGSAFESV